MGKWKANETDAGRMDGTINGLCRAIVLIVMRRLISFRDISLAEAALDRCRKRKVTLGDGVTYRTVEHRCSGDPFTSVCNTIIAIYAEYLAWRHSGKSHKEAWTSLGMHGGDDGLDFGMPKGANAWAYRQLGLILKEKTVLRGKPFVFLSRVFGPNAWANADPSNGADPLRALSQLNTTCANDLTVEQARAAKGISYTFTDQYSFLLGDVARKMASSLPNAEAWVIKRSKANRDVLTHHARQHVKRGGCFQEPGDDMRWYQQLVMSTFEPHKVHRLLTWCNDEKSDCAHPPVLMKPTKFEVGHPSLMIYENGDAFHVKGGPANPKPEPATDRKSPNEVLCEALSGAMAPQPSRSPMARKTLIAIPEATTDPETTAPTSPTDPPEVTPPSKPPKETKKMEDHDHSGKTTKSARRKQKRGRKKGKKKKKVKEGKLPTEGVGAPPE